MPFSGLSLKKMWQALLLCFGGYLSFHTSGSADLTEGSRGKATWRRRYLEINGDRSPAILTPHQLTKAPDMGTGILDAPAQSQVHVECGLRYEWEQEQVS